MGTVTDTQLEGGDLTPVGAASVVHRGAVPREYQSRSTRLTEGPGQCDKGGQDGMEGSEGVEQLRMHVMRHPIYELCITLQHLYLHRNPMLHDMGEDI